MARLTRSKSAALAADTASCDETKKQNDSGKNTDEEEIVRRRSTRNITKRSFSTPRKTKPKMNGINSPKIVENKRKSKKRKETKKNVGPRKKVHFEPDDNDDDDQEILSNNDDENDDDFEPESDDEFDLKPKKSRKSLTNGKRTKSENDDSKNSSPIKKKKEDNNDDDDDDDDDGDDWEEVEDFDFENYNPELPETVRITIQEPNQKKKAFKEEWIRMRIRCIINHMRKRNQLNAHKAHLLAFMARLRYLNEIINDDLIRALAMSLDHRPPRDLFEKDPKDFFKSFLSKFDLNSGGSKKTKAKKLKSLPEEIMEVCELKKTANPLVLCLILVAILRKFGYRTRLCYLLRPVPIKPGNLLTKKTRFEKNKPEPIPVEKIKIQDQECYWIELLDPKNQRWISFDLLSIDDDEIDGSKAIAARLMKKYKNISYVFSIDHRGYLADVTFRYSPNWMSYERVKSRIEGEWLPETFALINGSKIDDKYDRIELDRLISKAELPTRKCQYKNHPLFALQRDLLKYQALYPPDVPPIGYFNGEPIYARECVYTLKSRETWLKEARTVKPFEKPYKIGMSKFPKRRGMGLQPERQPMELFGVWQTIPYEPPVAKDGIVPRNGFGNVDLYQESMLPIGTVRLQLPGIAKVAARMNIDCAPAVVGFDCNRKSTGFHAVIDGYVVCKEFEKELIEEWERQQVEQEERAREKRLNRIYGNWRRLMRSLIIRYNLKVKYG